MDSHCNIRRRPIPRGTLDAGRAPRDLRRVNKRRIFIIALIALAAAAAILRAHPSAPAEHVVALAEAPPSAVRTSSPVRLVVYVAGSVTRPGVYRLEPGTRVESAIHAAGGLTAHADSVAVNLAEALRDGEEIVVPPLGAETGANTRRSAQCASPRRRRSAKRGSRFSESRARSAAAKSESGGSVDLNSAAVEELEALPGVGPHLAERIVVFRERNGPFASLDELGDVNGVSPRLLEELAPYVSVTEARTPEAWRRT